jgi:Tfp pilus assembly protein FimT
MFAKGMPVVAWGDEQGNAEYRMSLWQHGWTPGSDGNGNGYAAAMIETK